MGSGGLPSSGGVTGSGGSASGGTSSGGGTSTGGSSGGSVGSGGASGGSTGSGGAVGFQPCPATGSCKILPLGDSITEGVVGQDPNNVGGYRVPLFETAIEAGKDITFVGSRMTGNPPATVAGLPFPKGHEGESGIKIAALAAKTFLFDGVPDIVLLHIGTNDIFQNDNLSGAPDRLEAFVDEILAALEGTSERSQGLLVVAQLIPMPGNVSQLATYNQAVADLVDAKAEAGAHILLADMFTGYPDGTVELPDSIHPNAAGYARMAGTWYDVIESYLP